MSKPQSSARMRQKLTNILFPLLLGGGILYWMYREFDFSVLKTTMESGIHWDWVVYSMVFGVLAPLIRGVRWRQTLSPLGEHPSTRTCVAAVFLSYASSLVVPRSGELTRCGTLSKYDGISFTKSLGTVVTERIIDSVLVLLMTGCAILLEMGVFHTFFQETGTSFSDFFGRFTSTGYLVAGLCLVVTVVFLYFILRRMQVLSKVRNSFKNIKSGILSLRKVRNEWLFSLYTFLIWFCYFAHHSLAFQWFDFSSHLGFSAALVSFAVGSISVIVPTPNGAGPWHFSVKTILILYGITDENAVLFVLIVHTLQTALIPLLGLVGLLMLRKSGNLVTDDHHQENILSNNP